MRVPFLVGPVSAASSNAGRHLGNHRSQPTTFMTIVPGLARRVCIALAAWSALLLPPVLAAQAYSPAEQALFMTDHLGSARAPTTLRYTFRHSGSLNESFEDKVTLAVTAIPGQARCCAVTTEFLVGPRQINLPEVESPLGNPVILHFLERDIREMQRLTTGQPNYFRKRIRMAVFQGATITDIKVPYGGAMVTAQQVVIAPYTDDPLRARYDKFADKQYFFTLSPAVPGGVYAIRTRINGASPSGPPLALEEMVLDDNGVVTRATETLSK
jgi:hypothetical protein